MVFDANLSSNIPPRTNMADYSALMESEGRIHIVEVLDEMKSSKAGKLLAKMDAVKAATLAEKMANKAQPLNSGAE